MTRIELNENEVEVLRETVESAISDIRYEINNTDSHDYKLKLRENQAALEAVASRLETS